MIPVEEQQGIYEQAYPALEITETPKLTSTEKETKLQVLRELAKVLGVVDVLEESIRKMDLKTIDEQITFLEKKLKKKGREHNGSGIQVVTVTVTFNELGKYLAQGYEIVAQNREKYKFRISLT